MAIMYQINRIIFLVCILTYIASKADASQLEPTNSSIANECIDPPNSLDLKGEALQQMYTRLMELHVSCEPDNKNKILRKSSRTSHVAKLFKINSCPFSNKKGWAVPSEHGKRSSKTLQELRSCPWHLEKDFNVNRVPQMIYQAKCSCHQCIQPVEKLCEKDGTGCLRFSGSCDPIVVPFPVVRRTCAKGEIFFEYYGDIEYVSVGCTCRMNTQI